jgi:hypothetical protein
MNARGEDGRRLSTSYFDPNAARLHGGAIDLPSRSREGLGEGLSRMGASITHLALSPAELDDMNAALIEHFDPVNLSLPEIEAMQAMLTQAAARHRAEMEGPPEGDTQTDFFKLGEDKDFKAVGELEDIVGVEDELEEFDPEEDDWRGLDP